MEGVDKDRASATVKLQLELDEVKRELGTANHLLLFNPDLYPNKYVTLFLHEDLKIMDLEGKESELNALNKNVERMSSNQVRMEMEMHQMTDELDLARDTSRRLSQVYIHCLIRLYYRFNNIRPYPNAVL